MSAFLSPLYAEILEELNDLENKINSLLESQPIYAKPTVFQQLEGFVQLCRLTRTSF